MLCKVSRHPLAPFRALTSAPSQSRPEIPSVLTTTVSRTANKGAVWPNSRTRCSGKVANTQRRVHLGVVRCGVHRSHAQDYAVPQRHRVEEVQVQHVSGIDGWSPPLREPSLQTQFHCEATVPDVLRPLSLTSPCRWLGFTATMTSHST